MQQRAWTLRSQELSPWRLQLQRQRLWQLPRKNASLGIHADSRFLLENGNVSAAFIDILEISGILSMQRFAGLERDRMHMRDVLTGAFGLPSSSVQDLTLLSRILHVWEVSSTRAAERLLVASQYEAHGETLEERQSDYLICVEALDSAKGLVVADERVAGRMLLEDTIEQRVEGELYPDQFSDDQFFAQCVPVQFLDDGYLWSSAVILAFAARLCFAVAWPGGH